uniref:Zinc ribbon domain-containing protein n=1 Tax=candidate division WOR-3 bacterium TaxID=2052148 RepID=A0A7C4UAV0_UNCW3
MIDDEIIRLKNEREETLKKISLIEERRGTVRESVYQKVKSDYIAKLNEIENALKEKSGVIVDKIKSIEDEINNLHSQKESLEEQLEELDLRHSIGEYTDEQYESMLQELKSHITQIDEKIEFLNNEKVAYSELAPGAVSEETKEEKPKKKKTKEDEIVLPEVPKEEKLTEELFESTEISAEKAGIVETSAESAKPEVEDDWLSGLEKELGIGGEKEETAYIECPKCGFKNKPDAWYCENCGAELQK